MIIGLAGAKRSGKNTAAQLIKEQFENEYEIVEWSFAAKLKQSAVAALTGVVVSEEEAIEHCDWLKEEAIIEIHESPFHLKGRITGRQYLQWYGTEAHREIFGQDFWVWQLLDNIPNPATAVGTAKEWESRLDLITDVRFPNEAKAITSCGGRMIRINREEVENDGDTHASEKPLDKDLIWAEIPNNGTIEELKDTIRPHISLVIEETKKV